MANTKLKTVGPIISMEQQTSFAATSVTLGSAFSPPANVGDVWCYPHQACHWCPTGTVTPSTHHAVEASEMFMIPFSKLSSAEIIADSGSISLTVAYMRGSRPSIQHAVARPY